jgi:hypothetical protein
MRQNRFKECFDCDAALPALTAGWGMSEQMLISVLISSLLFLFTVDTSNSATIDIKGEAEDDGGYYITVTGKSSGCPQTINSAIKQSKNML